MVAVCLSVYLSGYWCFIVAVMVRVVVVVVLYSRRSSMLLFLLFGSDTLSGSCYENSRMIHIHSGLFVGFLLVDFDDSSFVSRFF